MIEETNKKEFIADDNTVRDEHWNEIGYVKKKKHNSPNQTDNVWGAPVKYTEEWVINELTEILKVLKADKEIVYIWELFEEKDYTRYRYSEWIKTYSKVDEIQKLSHTIKEILESRAVKGAITNKYNSTFTMFHLKNNFDWKDKQEIQNTNKNVNYEAEDSSEFEALLKDNDLI